MLTIEDNFQSDIYRKGKSGGSVKGAQGALSNFKKWFESIDQKVEQYQSMRTDDILRDLDKWVANMDSKGTNHGDKSPDGFGVGTDTCCNKGRTSWNW